MSAPWRIKFVKAPCWGLMRFFTGRDARFYGRRGGLPAVEGGILQPGPRGRSQFDGERANAASGALDGRLYFNRDVHRDGLGTVSDAFQAEK